MTPHDFQYFISDIFLRLQKHKTLAKNQTKKTHFFQHYTSISSISFLHHAMIRNMSALVSGSEDNDPH